MKILTISDNPNIFSGLAKVHRHVIDGLVGKGFDVAPAVWFAFDTKTMAMMQHGHKPEQPEYKGIKMYPLARNENAPLAAHDICKMARPDVVLTIGDHWNFYYMHAVKNKLDYKFKWVAYLTVEEEEIDKKKWQPLYRYMDAVCVPSQFGQDSIAKLGVKAHVIPYGVDEVFQRLHDEKRAQLRAERGIKDDEIRLITVAQNTLRKNLPSILQTAQELKSGSEGDKFKFYIHTNVGAIDPCETYVFDLIKLAKRLGVDDMVTFPKDVSLFEGSKDELLRDEYNASDYYLSTSLSEGYGMPVLEAMACGVPCLANATSTLFEHVGVPYEELSSLPPDKLRRALHYDYTRRGPRGALFRSRVDILPADKFVSMVDPKALAQELRLLKTMRMMKPEALSKPELFDTRKIAAACEDYARRASWKGMVEALAEVIGQMETRTIIPVEEI